MAIQGVSVRETSPTLPVSSGPTAAAESGSSGSAFKQVLGGVLGANAQANITANQAVQDLVSGKSEDLHTVSLAVAQADLTFRLILELRNRMTEAYQEVMRMQI